MKNQNDLIFSIAFAVVGLGSIAAFFFMKPVPVTPPGPTTVNVGKVELPATAPVMADSLGGGSNNGGSGMSGFSGPPPGFGGPPGMGGPGMSRGGAGKPGKPVAGANFG